MHRVTALPIQKTISQDYSASPYSSNLSAEQKMDELTENLQTYSTAAELGKRADKLEAEFKNMQMTYLVLGHLKKEAAKDALGYLDAINPKDIGSDEASKLIKLAKTTLTQVFLKEPEDAPIKLA